MHACLCYTVRVVMLERRVGYGRLWLRSIIASVLLPLVVTTADFRGWWSHRRLVAWALARDLPLAPRGGPLMIPSIKRTTRRRSRWSWQCICERGTEEGGGGRAIKLTSAQTQAMMASACMCDGKRRAMLMSDLQKTAPLWCTPTVMHSEPNDASDEENNNGHDHHDYSLAQ